MPIYLSSSFVFDSTEHAAELFALRTYGNIYSRIGNPTVAAFEERMASLEGGLGGVATASGLSAQLVRGPVDRAGRRPRRRRGEPLRRHDHAVHGYPQTHGDRVHARAGRRRRGVRAAVRPNTKLVFTETIGNPLGNVADLAALAGVAHDAGLPLVVDNTFATPALCRPIEWGADIVTNSATKFIGGHGTVIGGVIVESGTFPWQAGKHPLLSEPSPGYHDMNFAETSASTRF